MAQDKDLIAQLGGGGRDAMDRLLTRAQALAYRFGVRVCGNVPDAEDAMQDALLQTYRRADCIRDPQVRHRPPSPGEMPGAARR